MKIWAKLTVCSGGLSKASAAFTFGFFSSAAWTSRGAVQEVSCRGDTHHLDNSPLHYAHCPLIYDIQICTRFLSQLLEQASRCMLDKIANQISYFARHGADLLRFALPVCLPLK